VAKVIVPKIFGLKINFHQNNPIESGKRFQGSAMRSINFSHKTPTVVLNIRASELKVFGIPSKNALKSQ
jgi:hypothetical protein